MGNEIFPLIFMKRIWHISDTHTHEKMLSIPENIDWLIFSGDESNYNDARNHNECLDFLEWLEKVEIPVKIMIAGNHSFAIEKRLVTKKEIEKRGVIYLENSEIVIDGIKIFGTPYTPSFGNWNFMKDRSKMHKVWDVMSKDVDVIISHGPPKGILDLTYDRNNNLEMCGDSNIKTRLLKEEFSPSLFCFGHLHNCQDIINAGIVKLSEYDITFSNGSVVTDGKFGKITSNGNILEL